jgi:hypothetical protein
VRVASALRKLFTSESVMTVVRTAMGLSRVVGIC